MTISGKPPTQKRPHTELNLCCWPVADFLNFSPTYFPIQAVRCDQACLSGTSEDHEAKFLALTMNVTTTSFQLPLINYF
jgi:hypothetical protein